MRTSCADQIQHILDEGSCEVYMLMPISNKQHSHRACLYMFESAWHVLCCIAACCIIEAYDVVSCDCTDFVFQNNGMIWRQTQAAACVMHIIYKPPLYYMRICRSTTESINRAVCLTPLFGSQRTQDPGDRHQSDLLTGTNRHQSALRILVSGFDKDDFACDSTVQRNRRDGDQC